jgi:hypothetical protein
MQAAHDGEPSVLDDVFRGSSVAQFPCRDADHRTVEFTDEKREGLRLPSAQRVQVLCFVLRVLLRSNYEPVLVEHLGLACC